MSDLRATIARPVTLEGVGLHLGRPCRLTFRPAAAGTGRAFVRSDLGDAPATPAHASVAVFAERRTQLGDGVAALHTVEHVLAAVAAEEIDDLVVELDAPEPPVMDGSSLPFVEALRAAGRVEHGGPAPKLVIDGVVRLEDGVSSYEARPADGLLLDVSIDFPHPLIGLQRLCLEVTRESFARELAAARTFGFVHEVATLQAMGLIRGASTDNAVVVGPDGVVGNSLRWPDEFVRHKALDCVGDLALAGARVRAHVIAVRPSHSGTVRFVRELLARATQSVHAT